ncbi:hypothetical protein SLS55_010254 [Diplodia seriata]|uniref:Uncharacterized protein n=1 Tax=Diplodia seriata TaxID=420778 RepID=A0ABR3BYB3_9PEZI
MKSATIKRFCILCDNPYARCGSNAAAVEKREAVETEEEALFGPEVLTKRCCVDCDNNRCTRDVVPVRQWPEKRCCVNCDNPYARCVSGEKEKREAMGTLGEALFGVERA